MTSSSIETHPYDLREFIQWVIEEFEPSMRRLGGAGHYAREPGGVEVELYGVSDMACVLYTLGRLRANQKQREDWATAFAQFQDPETGYLLEKQPTHSALHNTAFALAAMELLDLAPQHELSMAAEFADPAAYLATLNWKTNVYSDSHKGAGIGAIYALVPEVAGDEPAATRWFDAYFSTCDALFDPANGMMGVDKPPGGDSDQIGGTFHYAFIYESFNRRMSYPEPRIDSVIGLQQPDGYWHPTNRLWLTLDAVYLLTRTVRHHAYRVDDVRAVVRRVMDVVMQDVFSEAGREKTFGTGLCVHSMTCALSIAAEAQQFLGADEVITDWPLRLVLDRRPFI
ncbi:MAG: hypothetical protein H7144_05150 [Burkholderiales bacterium]|nr:hypothetical protein [Phycisphaerae bacterium]